MKTGILLTTVLAAFLVFSCHNNTARPEASAQAEDTTLVADTGYTGIKQYMSNELLIKEVTFKNGVREGAMKSFYPDGRVRQLFLYRNGVREDSSLWYYQEGQVFRTTPYVNDTVDGIQKQFYRTGKLKARIGYKKGLRTPYLEEFTSEGKLIKDYPEIVVKTDDRYKSEAHFKVTLSLSDKSPKVRFYRGELTAGLFDSTKCERIKAIEGVATISLRKSSQGGSNRLNIVAEILTGFGNNMIVSREIPLPYNDLK